MGKRWRKGVLKIETPSQHEVVRGVLGYSGQVFPSGDPLPDARKIHLPYSIEGDLAQRVLNGLVDLESQNNFQYDAPQASYSKDWPGPDRLVQIIAGATEYFNYRNDQI